MKTRAGFEDTRAKRARKRGGGEGLSAESRVNQPSDMAGGGKREDVLGGQKSPAKEPGGSFMGEKDSEKTSREELICR